MMYIFAQRKEEINYYYHSTQKIKKTQRLSTLLWPMWRLAESEAEKPLKFNNPKSKFHLFY